MALTTVNGQLPLVVINDLDKLRIKKKERKMHFKLITFSNHLCTVGNLYRTYDDCVHTDEEVCHTIERPWLHNKPNISCIPAGIYTIEPIDSPKFGLTYEVKDVIGRTHILFHKANKPSELQGCIAPVSEFGVMDNEWAGFGSSDAYYPLMQLLGSDKHTLEIKRY